MKNLRLTYRASDRGAAQSLVGFPSIGVLVEAFEAHYLYIQADLKPRDECTCKKGAVPLGPPLFSSGGASG